MVRRQGCSDRGFLALFNQGFGVKAVADTTKTQVKSGVLVQANMAALSSLEESFLFLPTKSEKCSIGTRHDTTVPLMSVSMPAAVGAFKLAETKPDNC